MIFSQFTELYNLIHNPIFIIHNSQKSEKKSNAHQQANEQTRKQTEAGILMRSLQASY